MSHGGFHGQLGQGGTGTNEAFPSCPACHARKGGAHGGYCPNTNQPDPAQWTAIPPPGFVIAAPRRDPAQ
jgi:hypothetical protein